jgi:hypothetical protein
VIAAQRLSALAYTLKQYLLADVNCANCFSYYYYYTIIAQAIKAALVLQKF